MYIVEYFKSDGKTVILEVRNNRQLKDIVTSLTDRVISGTVISFNVEVIE